MKKTTYNQIADIDIAIRAKSMNEFMDKAMGLFADIKKVRPNARMDKIITISNFKYKIHGEGITRHIDLFRISGSHSKLVKGFHLPPVRMYYDGDLYMLRSCVVALITGIGEGYKWFSCNKIPAEIVLKYAQRGITVILNQSERLALSRYLANNDRWSQMFNKYGIDPQKIYGRASHNHVFFRPDLYSAGTRIGIKQLTRPQDYNCIMFPTEYRYDITKYGDLTTRQLDRFIMPNIACVISGIDHAIIN